MPEEEYNIEKVVQMWAAVKKEAGRNGLLSHTEAADGATTTRYFFYSYEEDEVAELTEAVTFWDATTQSALDSALPFTIGE